MKKSIILLSSICLLGLSSCANKLDITPTNNITDEQIQDLLANGTDEEVELVMGSMANGMPQRFRSNGINGIGASDLRYYDIQGLDFMRCLSGNDMVYGTVTTSGFGSEQYKFINIRNSDQTAVSTYWYWAWANITAANKMLFYLEDEAVVNAKASLQKYRAWGLVVRAYSYNFLMENYQDAYLLGGSEKLGIMLYDTYNPSQENKARSSAKETFDFIKKDINEAITLLNAAGVGYTADKTDIDMAVAKFVLARVSLNIGDWSTAISACNDIMNQYTTFIPEAAYGGKNTGTVEEPAFIPEDNAFLNNEVNPEAILGWPVGEGLTTYAYWLNCFGSRFSGGSTTTYARIDNRLYEQIAEQDFRKDAFMSEDFGDYVYEPDFQTMFIPVYTNTKFAATQGIGTTDKTKANTVTDCYMRMSEVLLMKADAEAQSGNETAAKATLNQLLAARTRTGATALTCDTYPAMQGLSALQMVQLQTRIEMWGEKGLEYYNNKRWGIPVDRTSSSTHVEKGGYSVAQMTLQIPDDEMFYNPLCVQNN